VPVRLIVAVVLIAIAIVVALLLRRRRPQAPTQPRWQVPTQLDRADFARPDAPWLVALFSSSTCDSCEATAAKASLLASHDVAYQDISYQTSRDLHERYSIDVVPMILLADREGVVKASFIGTPAATDLWAAVAAARESVN
jgi:hypothetical protein